MNLSRYVRFVHLKIMTDNIFRNEKFLVDYLTENISVKRLDRFALTVICLVLFIRLFVCFFEFFLLLIMVLKCLYLSYKYKVTYTKRIRLKFVSD